MISRSSLPTHKRLNDQFLRARLMSIRERVTPILATNNLPHFTDHSVDHSDHLCSIVDSLTEPISERRALSDQEAFVVYAACYLHDVGMQHQNAGNTDVIKQVLKDTGQHWSDLSVDSQRQLLRDYHNKISAEMVRSCVNEGYPILGITLTIDDSPGYIASLCEAHCLPTDGAKYLELTAQGPQLRMPVLSALLRMADILDESRRRAQLYREQTVALDLTSRMHWWRHYYVENVSFDGTTQCITIWFDFPKARRNEYADLVPELQLPFLKDELDRQAPALADAGLYWSLKTAISPAGSTVAAPMPDEVQIRMVAELNARRRQGLQIERMAVLNHLIQQRPVVQRQMAQLHSEAATSSPEILHRAVNLAQQLWSIGGRRDAWVFLSQEIDRFKSRLDSHTVLNAVLTLIQMMLDDEALESALHEIQWAQPIIETLDQSDDLRLVWLECYAKTLLYQPGYAQAVNVLEELVELTPKSDERDRWIASLAELHMLHGEVKSVDTVINQYKEDL